MSDLTFDSWYDENEDSLVEEFIKQCDEELSCKEVYEDVLSSKHFINFCYEKFRGVEK